ncbi:twin-arginine translocase TatA/TatE family subunit [Corynebacterium parakroppenstedtii]|uniref:twin-arginine translocase TatA/TatE family subunit n=1 Tax=Corynebacterium parakroppenstedtii TaxID=2828363 RepID=UPI001C8F3114|nr:twin-arginine translocase TatA/TatE family subunit [Corynebacterium parakroppenstedtii]MBY0795565.1 twin-arginine translocase TatA/TatE family subunit [Corynebacterium parakroppenstedtii]
MFSSIGWMEVIIIVVVGFLIIGPDRLPGVMKEIRAVRLAIKNAVADARKQIDGELGEDLREFSEPIKEFREPLRQFNSYRSMGAKGFIAKALFDDDTTDLDATKDAIEKPLQTMRTTTPQRAIQDYFAADNPSSAKDADDATSTAESGAGSQASSVSVEKRSQGGGGSDAVSAHSGSQGREGGQGTVTGEPGKEQSTDAKKPVYGSWSGFDEVL